MSFMVAPADSLDMSGLDEPKAIDLGEFTEEDATDGIVFMSRLPVADLQWLDSFDLPELLAMREQLATDKVHFMALKHTSAAGQGRLFEAFDTGGDSGGGGEGSGVRHAPEGGQSATGKDFKGGQFLPSEADDPVASEKREKANALEESDSPNTQAVAKQLDTELKEEKKEKKAKKGIELEHPDAKDYTDILVDGKVVGDAVWIPAKKVWAVSAYGEYLGRVLSLKAALSTARDRHHEELDKAKEEPSPVPEKTEEPVKEPEPKEEPKHRYASNAVEAAIAESSGQESRRNVMARILGGFGNVDEYNRLRDSGKSHRDAVIDVLTKGEPEEGPREDAPLGNPHTALATAFYDHFKSGAELDAKTLFALADKAHGGTRAQGKYGPSDAYDAMEAGFNMYLRDRTDPTRELFSAQKQAHALAEELAAMPTQTNRSGNKDSYQQFSTPPHYSFAANWVANIQNGENVVEPSAGTNSLGVHAQNAGANVYANEYDPRRADFLRQQLGDENVHVENAEHISAIFPKKGVPTPTVVVMNPPFSQTAGRMGDKKEIMTGANHIEEALKLLAPGGRLVSIVGRGMGWDSPTFSPWFKRIGKDYNVRANIAVSGDEYKKYGTHFSTRLLVIDKDGPQKSAPVLGEAEDIPDLMAKLEGVRNDRHGHSKPATSESTGDVVPQGVGVGTRPAEEPAPGIGDRVPGDVGTDSDGGLPGGTLGGGNRVPEQGPNNSNVDDGSRPGVDGTGDRGQPGPGTGDVSLGSPGESLSGSQGDGAKPGGKKRSRKSVQLVTSHIPELRPPEPLHIEVAEPEVAAGAKLGDQSPEESADSLYETYKPSLLRIPGSFTHPTPLVETAAMASVKPPVPTYRPHLSRDIIEQKKSITHTMPDGSTKSNLMGISEAGLEAVVYAGQAHEKFLPSADKVFDQNTSNFIEPVQVRRGFFIGDGTGSGKGREISGIISDNINQGRKKHVWVSEKWPLVEDAKRDLGDVGVHPDKLVPWKDLVAGNFQADEGIGFVTYSTLAGKGKADDAVPNVDKMIAWLGPDFDGVIAFDEAHNMGNASMTKGPRGDVDASQMALAGMKLQQALPKARVVYVSATGATEVKNLTYADRLGLWGKGTAFPTRADFVGQMNKGGTTAMEAVAQSMKAMGMYTNRSLAMSDGTDLGSVQFDRLAHTLTPEQKYIHGNLVTAWRSVLGRIDDAIQQTTPAGRNGKPIKKGGRQRGNAISQFWGSSQRFWNQVMTSMQTPTTILAIEEDLKAGRAPIVSLVNTLESTTTKKLKEKKEDESLEDIDVSPKEILMGYVQTSFPIHRQETSMDDNGNVILRIALDGAGKPIVDPRALAMKNELLANIKELNIPESPIDQIINHFGHDSVAEVTGRSIRLIDKVGDDGVKRREKDRRPSDANTTEAQAFQDGKKKILIFSAAGGTGRSYHAERGAKNQGRRSFYMLQPGWRADKAVQALGRAHRSNQTSAPLIHLVEIPEIPGQRRFVSTIARRLAQLGALTRGERKAGSSGLFKDSDNLEHPLAQEALDSFLEVVRHGAIEGLDHDTLMEQLGFEQADDDDRRNRTQRAQTPDIKMPQFLNRLLSVNLDFQHKLMKGLEDQIEAKFSQAQRDGTLDSGVENYNSSHQATNISKEKERVIFTDKETGATAKHIQAKVYRKIDKLPWATMQKNNPDGFVKNNRSGRVWGVYPAAPRTDATTGRVDARVILRGPLSEGPLNQRDLTTNYLGNYTTLTPEEARPLWDKEHDLALDHSESTEHFIAGAMLPIWDRLPDDKPKIYRVKMDNGESIVARHIPRSHVEKTLQKLGAGQEETKEEHTPTNVHQRLKAGKFKAHLSNGWAIHPSLVQGERRIELTGPMGLHWNDLEGDGVFRETIAHNRRYFIPVGEDGPDVIERITKSKPVIRVEDLGKGAYAPA